ncbi:MAG: 2Fe-2S iron-sulfur cluster binding domain-containing protein, partial [Planctomycetia bacterium]|nr:2Fe-2S iron-sulfur cluster binding domain-containing protein [Planctomycetia bacterium]
TKIRQAAAMAGVNVYQGINGFGASINKILNCHGLGCCGTCSVNVVKGMENTSQMGLMERMKYKGLPVPDLACMQYIGNEATMRLACKAQVTGDIEVQTAPHLNLFGDNFFS